MEEFISMIVEQLGLGEQETRSATGGVLDLLKDKLDDSTFSQVMDKLPGAESLVGASESGESGGGGLFGSLTSMAGSLMGGEGVGNIVKIFSDAGIGLDQATAFLSKLVEFLKDKLGGDLFSTVASNLPDLIGGAEK